MKTVIIAHDLVTNQLDAPTPRLEGGNYPGEVVKPHTIVRIRKSN